MSDKELGDGSPYIRRASVDDAAEIARIHVESWRAAYQRLVPKEYLDSLDVGYRTAEWVPVLTEAKTEIFVVERGVVPSEENMPPLRGFFQLSKRRDADLSEDVAELWLIYIEPQSFRRGLGSLLMNHAVELSRTLGYRALSLWTLKGREASNLFYVAHGFRADRESYTPCWRDAPRVETRRYIRDYL